MRAKILIPLLLACALAAALLLGAFGSSNPPAPTLGNLQNAAEATARSTGVHIALAITATGGPVQVSATGGGEMDPATQEADLSMQINASGALGQQTSIAERITGGSLYVESPQLSEQLGEGRRWMSIDLKQLGQAVGVSPTSANYGVNPNEYLDYLRADGAQVSARGTQTLRGESVTWYTGTLNLIHAVEVSGGPNGAKAAERLSSQLRNPNAAPVEAWVDSQGRVRKLALSLEATSGGRMSIESEYFDFGPIKPVLAPPPGEVFDLTSLLLAHLP